MNSAPPSGKTAEWTSDDAINLRNFLASQSGERLLVHLGEAVPELLSGGEINAILIRSGEVKGGSANIVALISLTIEPPKSMPDVSKKDSHPDLDDDSKFDPVTNLPIA